MIFVQVCLGSSCHLKGSMQLVEMLKKELAVRGLEDTVILSGSFCLGKCNREGVTIQVEDDVFTNITPENFKEFFDSQIVARIKAGE